MKDLKAQVTRMGLLDMQVCVPSEWTDEQVTSFAEKENPCGTQYGWELRKQGSEYLAGADGRVKCTGRQNFVHIVLDA